ncbi:MAG TPA: hypothetical protein VMX13_10435 [Sedimentisphaerales bacterium]|nr:hypothetical protein [Sedimentisphaerales bacterium]
MQMKKLLTICFVAASLFAASSVVQSATLEVRLPGGTGALGDVYTSIQAAIDDANDGDTIIVHAGTYDERIIVDKAITLQGAGSATTTIDGGGGSGSNVTVVYITAAGDVTFSGFTVKNAPITLPGDLRFGILTNSPVSDVTYTISNNKVIGTNDPDAEEDYGIYGRNGGKENLVITNNQVTQTGANNIVIETHQGTTDISYNTLDAGCYGVDAIFVMTHSGKDVANLQKVAHNTIDMGTGSGTSSATGITFAAVAAYYGVSPARFLDHSIEITNNNISNLSVNRRGIGFWNDAAVGSEGDIVSPLVSNNTITGASGDVSASMGIDTIGLVTDANVANNTVTGVDYSFKERVWRDNVAAGTQLNLNCFSGNSGGVLTERTTGVLNAERNAWGDASGPHHPVTNTGGLGDEVSDGVAYYPWYPDCDFTTPVYKPVHNVTINAYYDTIQGAIDEASDGDEITADPITYNESVTIDVDNLTITGIEGSLPTITGGVTLAGLSGLTLENFVITGDGGSNSVIRMTGAVTDLTLDNCVLDGENVSGRMGLTGGQLEGDVTITNCELKNLLGWAVLDSKSGSGGDGSAMGTVTFADNNIHHCNGSIVFRGLSSDRTDVVNAYGNTWNSIGGNNAETGQQWAALEINRAVAANVYGNTISGVSEGEWGEGQALQVWDIDTLDVYDNTLTGNFQGIYVHGSDPAYGGSLAVPGGAIYCNSISGNSDYGISVDPSAVGGPLNAELNWWGDTSGPSGSGGGTGDAALGDVDFFPWLLSTDCNDLTEVVADYVVDDDWEGLPDWSTVSVGGVDYYIGLNAFDTIQGAIDAASDGNSISVAAGTYNEAVLIGKSLSIRGATADLNKNGYTVPAGYAWDDTVESIINHPNPSGGYVTIVDIYDVNDVTFEGFVVQELNAEGNKNSSLVRVYAVTHEISNIKVRNNVIGGNTNVAAQDGAQGRMGLYIVNHPYSDKGVVNSTFSGNKIFDCKGNGDNIFIWSSYFAYGAPGPASMRGTVIEDNEIYGSHRAGIETAGGYADLTIRRNTIYGNTGLISDDPNNLKYGNGILLIRGSSDKLGGATTAYGPVNLTIKGNEIFGNEKNGIYSGPILSGVSVTGNAMYDNGWDAVRVDLEGTYWNPTFEPEPNDWSCYDAVWDVEVSFNNLFDNGSGVRVVGIPTNGFVVDATYNWWGDVSGPADPCGTSETDGVDCHDVSTVKNADGLGDAVTADVEYCPWLVAPPSSSNNPLPAGDLNFDGCINWLDLAALAEGWLDGCEE